MRFFKHPVHLVEVLRPSGILKQLPVLMIFVLIKVCRKLPVQDFALVDEICNCCLAHNLSQSLAKNPFKWNVVFEYLMLPIMQSCQTNSKGIFFVNKEPSKQIFSWIMCYVIGHSANSLIHLYNETDDVDCVSVLQWSFEDSCPKICLYLQFVSTF